MIGNWTDETCYYTDVRDGGKVGFLSGPYRTEEEARADLEAVKRLANEANTWSWFYEFGTCSLPTGYRTGLFNDRLNPHGWTGYRTQEVVT